MYKRGEASRLRHNFWTTFGQYMAPIPSAEGLKINWINYKTGFKNIHFKMNADQKKASIGIELTQADIEIQEFFFQQFNSIKTHLHQTLNEEWDWFLHAQDDDGKVISKIYKEISPVNIFNKEDWPDLITFFKPRILALDEFWSEAKYGFEGLS
jgi:hypothetical protein